MNKNQILVRISWSCPICGCSGGFSGPNMNEVVGLCIPVIDEEDKAHCFGCGWLGEIDDATITAVEVTKNTG